MNKILKISLTQLLLTKFSKSQLFYPSTIIEQSSISTQEDTNQIKLETIYSICKCNKIPGTCDPFCCCDPNCTPEYNKYQEETLKKPCGGSISDFTDTCFTKSYIYKVNKRKGVQVIPNSDPMLICIRGGQIGSDEFIAIEGISDGELSGLRIQAEILANQSINSVLFF